MAANPVVPVPELLFETRTTETETTLCCTGKIVSSTAAQFRDAVKNLIPEKKSVTLDLSGAKPDSQLAEKIPAHNGNC